MRLVSALAALLAVGGAALAQNIEFIEPASTTVRGDVKVQVDLGPAYQNGSVAFYLGPAGETLEFNSATIADGEGLYSFDWRTQGQRTRVADGEYRVLAIGYNAAGEVIGQKSITIEVQNDVPQTQIPATGILLRYNLTPGRRAHFRGNSVISVEGGEGLGDDAFKELKINGFGGAVSASWAERVLWRNPDGKAQVRNSVYRQLEVRPMLENRDMEASGKFISLLHLPQGQVIRRGDMTPAEFPFAEMSIEFPDSPVKVGDQWRSKMPVLVDPRSNYVAELVATHTLTGVEWHEGQRCAVIKSEYEGGPYRLTLAGVKIEETSTGGGEGGPGAVSMPSGPSGPGGSGGSQSGPVEDLWGTTIIVKGVRTTYFAFQPEVGAVLKIEENMEQRCAIESSGSSSTGGGPEMGEPGGILGPGNEMGPSGGPPGMMGPMTGPPGMMGPMTGPPTGGPLGSGGSAALGSAGMGPGLGSAGMGPISMGGSASLGGSMGGQSTSDEIKVAHFTRVVTTTIEQDPAIRQSVRYQFR